MQRAPASDQNWQPKGHGLDDCQGKVFRMKISWKTQTIAFDQRPALCISGQKSDVSNGRLGCARRTHCYCGVRKRSPLPLDLQIGASDSFSELHPLRGFNEFTRYGELEAQGGFRCQELSIGQSHRIDGVKQAFLPRTMRQVKQFNELGIADRFVVFRW